MTLSGSLAIELLAKNNRELAQTMANITFITLVQLLCVEENIGISFSSFLLINGTQYSVTDS